MSRDERRALVGRYATMPLALAIALFFIPTPAWALETVESVKASSYGAYANVDVAGDKASVGPKPSASVPSSGGSDSSSLATIDLSSSLIKVLSAKTLGVSASGTQVGTPDGTATAQASVEDLKLISATLLPAVVQADAVTASCEADVGGVSGTTKLASASVAGIGSLNASPAPNTSLNVAGVGTLWLNRQVTDSAGNLTVTGIQLILDLDLVVGFVVVEGTGTVNIARATCGVVTQQVTTTTSSSPTTSTSSGASSATTSSGATTSTSSGASSATTSTTTKSTTTSTDQDDTTTTSSDDSTTTTVVETTTTTDDACAAHDQDDNALLVASNNEGAFDALHIGGAASMGDGDGLPVVLAVLILLAVAALGAVGGYSIHKFGVFDRIIRPRT